MKKVVAAIVVLAGVAAAGTLADWAVEREREYLRLIDQGDGALNRGQAFVAIEHYSGAIALKPESMLAYLKRGEAHQRRGDTPETLSAALRDLRKAADLDPGATRTLEKLGDVNMQLRRFRNAADNYEAYIALDNHAAPIFYKLALASRGDGNLVRAISALQDAVKLNPSFHEAHYVHGLCLKERNQLDDARAALERAIAISPAFMPAREELAELHRLQERPHDEIEQLDALHALEPNKPERLIALGRAHLRAGSRDFAVITLGRAAERFKEYPGVYAALGQVWLEAAEGRGDPSDLGKALEALEPVATQSTASSETLGMYGRALALANRHAEAEAVFKQAAQRFPIDPQVLPHFASVAQRLGHLDEARQALVKYSVLVDEDREEAVHAARIADLSMQLNDAVAAAAWYQKSDTLRTSDASLLARMADAQWRAGQTDKARTTLTRAIEKDPNHPLVRSVSRRLQAR
ncbi:MAG TPA: tetratricopeptide repeat protein [Vicinamibacterales bacterium]|nr:tetratricopeptide repeat protein [Vicinamibacterales bacterium]